MNKITYLLVFLINASVFSQLTVNNTTINPTQLVQNVLLGTTVTATNIKFNGSVANANTVRDQAASFTTNFNQTNLGLESGVLLTTGKSQVALGPNNNPSNSIVSTDAAFNGDSDLATLSGRPVSDVRNSAILEFDFVATGENLTFDFVFASEEYPEYSTNPVYNDSFGFFLSGPGITGPFSGGAKNVALIPNTTIPISIGTVNNGNNNNGTCTNCNFYYNNSNIGTNPTTWTGQTVQYDGFTTVLTATSALQCGQTYHIKLAIANIGDNNFDSGVFLKAGSFNIATIDLGQDLELGTDSAVCFGGSTTIDSGLPAANYTFVWRKNGAIIAGESSPTLVVTTPGTYQISVSTATGCPLQPEDIVIEFQQPINAGTPNNLFVCDTPAANEIFNLVPNTALVLQPLIAADYEVTYHTSQIAAENNTGAIPSSSLSSFPSAGQTIYVRVTDFNDGCYVVKPFLLVVGTNPSGTFSYSPASYCTSVTAAQPVTSTVTSGGTYSALPAGLSIDASTGAITPSLSTPNTYSITYLIPASGSCPAYSTTANVTINPTPVAPTLTATQPTCTVGSGSITITAPLGANLEYSIDGTSYQAGNIFAIVPPGTYAVTVRDVATLCTSTSVPQTINPAVGVPGVIAASVTQQPTCTTPTGTITVTAPFGATLQYSNNGGPYQPTLIFAVLAPGSTNVITVQDTSTLCIVSAAAITVNGIPANPVAPTATATQQPTCPTPTGTITVTAPTGTTLEYSINGSTYQPTLVFAGLAPSSYNVTVRDTATGCVSTATSVTINAVPGAPAAPVATITQPTCAINTGSLVVTSPTGANFEYSLNSGTYQAGTSFTSLTAGQTYTITVRNTTTSCTAVSSFVITPALNVPVAAVGTASQPNCIITTGTITITSPVGGTLQYSNNGGTFQSSPIFTGLAAGSNNSIVVLNTASGCSSTAAVITVNAITPNPTAPIATITQTPTCTTPTGTITVNPTTTGFEYSNNGGTYQNSGIFAGLAPNSSNIITIRQIATGCTTAAAAIVMNAISANPAAPVASVTKQPTCTVQTGTITVTAPTGADFQYSINGGAYQTQATFANLSPSTSYTITVKSTSTGCTTVGTANLVAPIPPIPATPIASGNNVCVNGTINLTTPTLAGATYTWTGPNGFTSSLQNPSITSATEAMTGIYSVVVRITADCPSLAGTVAVTVYPLPIVTLLDGYVCVDSQTNAILSSYTLDTQLLPSDYSFEWFTVVGNTQTIIAGETQSTYTANAPGTYGVIVTSTSTTPNCSSSIATAVVGQSSAPKSITTTASNYFASIQSVTVIATPSGTYEYQIDNGGFQESNVFTNVGSGSHKIDVRDINQCGMISKDEFIVDYPKYFTPNGDGYHDTWNISALSGQANAKIYIFDRFGKLLKQITPATIGWDGSFNNEALPSTDYWFVVNYVEKGINREFKGNFAIKR